MSDNREIQGRPNHLIGDIRKNLLPFFLLLISLLLSCKTEKSPAQQNCPPPHKQSTPYVVINNETLSVEIRSTPKERARGLMFRDSLPDRNGMFFIFEFEAKHVFWMKNTTIPLSIAFINSKFTIIDIQDMTPLSMEGHIPRFPCLYALEVNQHWFSKREVRIGDTVQVRF